MPAAARPRVVLLSAVVLGALAFAGTAGAALDAAGAGWITGPRRVVQGNPIRIEARVPSGTRCALSFRYRNGAVQKGLGARMSAGGRAAWEWRVPKTAKPGAAVARVSCGRQGTNSLTVMVIGEVIPATITVVKQGFSVRPRRFSGADVSWGAILRNTSPQSDAITVTVLANLVLPDNRLIGSQTVRVGRIAAGKEHALGGDLSFLWVPPIVRVEVVVQIADSGRGGRTFPGVANARFVADPFEPGIVGSIEGEVVNDNATKTLERANVSAVVLDAAGNVLGGQTGFVPASLPPSARVFFKISGMRAVLLSQAASVVVSTDPTYRGDR